MSRIRMEQFLKNYSEISFPKNNSVSEAAKHMISKLCQKSVSGRFSPNDALKHPWITRKLDQNLPCTRKELHE
jgi:serine/threonine protein kinase